MILSVVTHIISTGRCWTDQLMQWAQHGGGSGRRPQQRRAGRISAIVVPPPPSLLPPPPAQKLSAAPHRRSAQPPAHQKSIFPFVSVSAELYCDLPYSGKYAAINIVYLCTVVPEMNYNLSRAIPLCAYYTKCTDNGGNIFEAVPNWHLSLTSLTLKT